MPFVIDDDTPNDVLFDPVINGEMKGRGHDESQRVPEMFEPPSDIPLIPRSEWDARIKEQEERKSSLWHLRQYAANGSQMPTLDQNGQGYCWAYSVTRCVMYTRAVMNQPYVRLSAHGVACRVKAFRDEGGWCGLSAQFIRQNGVPSVAAWPEKSMSRANDNAASRENALLHKTLEEWVDLTKAAYDQNLTFDMVASCLLLNIPCALDFNWWGHSVCGIQLVKVSGSYGVKIDNSWTDSWGELGTSVLTGQKMIPDGALAIRTSRPTTA